MLSHKLNSGLRPLTAGILLTLFSGLPVYADDTEIFVGQGAVEGPEARPNILFIIDTSGSMDDRILTQPTYNPATNWDGACGDDSRIYYVRNSTTVPTCAASNNNWVNLTSIKCKAALDAFNSSSGFFAGRAARYDSAPNNVNNRYWIDLDNTTAARSQNIECQTDSGVHGDGVNTTNLYARNQNTNAWGTSNSSNLVNWGSRSPYRFYTSNYLNWYHENRLSNETKLEIVQNVSKNLIDQVSGVNVGLMRYSTDAQGGMVVSPVTNVADSRTTLKAQIDAFTPQGNTPLSETLYEAGLYWRGATWDYGSRSSPSRSVATSRQTSPNTRYKSPIEYSCQSNYIVYLTDGLPTTDTDANEEISALNGTTCTGQGQCLDDMAEYLFNNDQSTLAGNQNVITYTVGFDTDFPLLEETATKGGGAYYTANDTGSLSGAFTNIVQEILDTSATFTSPTVAVNAFNRTQNLNDLFITVFKPTDTLRWPGNIKKYRLDPTTGDIEDVNGIDAVDDTTGFFKPSARSYWSDVTDGDNVVAGGAANEIPGTLTRNVYTYWSGSASTTLTNVTNSVSSTNLLLVANLLLSQPLGGPLPTDVISWARGVDVRDEDADGVTLEPRNRMGDPLHARPATVIYGGTTASPNINDAVVFAATNEGYVHALDPVTGAELWSFIPDMMLPKLYDLYANPASSTKFYGVDGNMQVLKIDIDRNGIVESAEGDRVYLYFGLRRGGNAYYALDVTDKNTPRFLWKNTSTQLPGLGQTWSTPAVAKVNVNSSSQTQSQKYVLIFGGGYEEDQDPNSTTQLTSYSTDTVGNRIFMVDAATGARLWYAGGATSGANLLLDGSSGKPTMNNSIPADIRVIDLDNDSYADRLYAGDMGGRIWRFDITNGNAPASLVTGGVFATLGNADETTHPAASTRRFYYAPDVALIRDEENTFLNITIGSGYRASPLNLQVEDRIYALRDRNVFNKLTQAQYNSFVKITDGDSQLIDVTDDITTAVPATAKGWKINLTDREGEKVLAEARTFQNRIFVSTYTPYDGETPADPCIPRQGTNRLYVMEALNGAPIVPDALTPEDRFSDLGQGGIAPEAVFLFPTPDEDCEGDECKPEPECLVGLENCGVELTNNPVRTFWTQQNVDN